MLRRPTFVILVGARLLGVGAACDSFGSSGTSAPDAAPADVTSSSSSGSIPGDAGTGASCIPNDRPLGDATARVIHPAPQPPEAPAYPFAIATTATHVYWLEQLPGIAPGDTASAAYNGHSTNARLRRVAKLGGAATVVASGPDLAKATVLARSGDFLYWVSPRPNNEPKKRIFRVPADCDVCAPSVVTEFDAADVEQLEVASEGELVLRSANSVYFVYTPGSSLPTGRGGLFSNKSSSFALVGPHVFAVSGSAPGVQRATVKGSAGFEEGPSFPAAENVSAGAHRVASDCQSLFAVRNETMLWRGSADGTVPFTFLAQVDPGLVFDIAADTSNVYLAFPNGGGLYAVNKETGARKKLFTESVFRIAVDADGLYWGDHDGLPAVAGPAGAIWMQPKQP